MPSVTDAIKNRRSTRKYSPKPIPKKILTEILEAARWAPSAHNAQPWRFIILTDVSAKRALAKAMMKAWIKDLTADKVNVENREEMTKASIQRFAHAPVLVLACLTMTDMKKYADERQQIERDLAIQSLGAAIQNMLLSAHSEGLGACWLCAPAFCKDAVTKALAIPEDLEPQALITLGHSAEKPTVPKRKLFEDIFTWDY